MLLKIKAMVVIIVGRISSGKMSFSHQLVDSYPFGGGANVRYEGSERISRKTKEQLKDPLDIIRGRAKNGLFTTVVCEQTSSDEIRNFISSLRGVKAQVLMFDLDDALLDEFLSNNKTKYNKSVIAKDSKTFDTVRNMKFPENVISVTQITNPKEIKKIEFELNL